ncbi:MAG: YdbL family protein [Desulfobulbaceae bacterium]|uniref:YdbL family protein n=1 Tax=Candidatus Desulfatifera sulfidica TaxID=2841691 RepID=A0A8J6NB09_9BACT|nr:YdbL family protein [Candidatus Desulfatifera sulfidica]
MLSYRPLISLFMSLLFLTCLFIPMQVEAQSVKERMAARLPIINALKDQGIIGEDNQGFLQYRSVNQPDKQVIDTENDDRQSVYLLIGEKEMAPPLLVGQRRAQKLVELAKPGHWLQNKFGRWYQKK